MTPPQPHARKVTPCWPGAGGNCAPAQRGLTLVEVLVGLAVGSLILTAALTHVAAQLAGLQRLTDTARTEHELRLVLAHMARQLRSAGHGSYGATRAAERAAEHAAEHAGRAATDGSAARPATPAFAGAPDPLRISPGRIEFSRTEHHNTGDARLQALGYRLHDGALQARVAGNSPWQSLTDPATLHVTDLQLHLIEESDALAGVCHTACPSVADHCAPGRASRTVAIELTYRARREPTVTKSIMQMTHLRNDLMEVTCAAA